MSDNIVHTNDSDRAACAAITALAKQLGKYVIAEGVETEQQATLLVDMGCDGLQGFLFGEPTAAEGITAQLNRGLVW